MERRYKDNSLHSAAHNTVQVSQGTLITLELVIKQRVSQLIYSGLLYVTLRGDNFCTVKLYVMSVKIKQWEFGLVFTYLHSQVQWECLENKATINFINRVRHSLDNRN